MFLDIAVYALFTIIGVALLAIVFKQEREIATLNDDVTDVQGINAFLDRALTDKTSQCDALINQIALNHAAQQNDANGSVKRGEHGRFVSMKGGKA